MSRHDFWIFSPNFKKHVGAYYFIGMVILVISFGIDCWLYTIDKNLDIFPRVGSLVTLLGLLIGVLSIFSLHHVEQHANWTILVASELGTLKIKKKNKHLPDDEVAALVEKNIQRAKDESEEMIYKAEASYKLLEVPLLIVGTVVWGWGDLLVIGVMKLFS